LDNEVCCVRGVWITDKHPVVDGERWVSPCELAPTAPWHKRQHVMPDMFTFELEGHDDTIILWGGAGHAPLVSCTLSKDLGPGFERDVWTRLSTRCPHQCVQCDVVFVPGIRFDADMDPVLRPQTFSVFPQVEWECAAQSEFQLASQLITDIAVPIHSAPESFSGMHLLEANPLCVTCIVAASGA